MGVNAVKLLVVGRQARDDLYRGTIEADLDEPVKVVCEIHMVAGEGVELRDSSEPWDFWGIRVEDPEGTQREVPPDTAHRTIPSNRIRRVAIKPGQPYRRRLTLSGTYRFRIPGEYRGHIYFVGGRFESSIVHQKSFQNCRAMCS